MNVTMTCDIHHYILKAKFANIKLIILPDCLTGLLIRLNGKNYPPKK